MSNYVDNIKKKIDGVPTEVDIHDKRLANITGDSQTLLSLNESGDIVPVRTNSPITSSNLVATMDDVGAGGGYIKPETGIPKSDLDASIQASLNKADISIPNTEKGANNGVATLDSAGKVPTSQLPSGSTSMSAYFVSTTLTTPVGTYAPADYYGQFFIDMDGKVWYSTSNSSSAEWKLIKYLWI